MSKEFLTGLGIAAVIAAVTATATIAVVDRVLKKTVAFKGEGFAVVVADMEQIMSELASTGFFHNNPEIKIKLHEALIKFKQKPSLDNFTRFNRLCESVI